VLDHLKSIRIAKASEPQSSEPTNAPMAKPSVSKLLAPRDAKLAEELAPQLPSVQEAPVTKSLIGSISSKLHAAHQKALALKHIAEKADIDNSEEAKNSAHALQLLPFILPPIGIIFLGVITYSVIRIRNWQKIPSMPTHGRLDIEAVRESAERAGGKAYEHREMKHATAVVR